MRRQHTQLIGNLERKGLLVVVHGRDVDEGQETEAPASWVELNGHFAVTLLGVDYIDQHVELGISPLVE